MGGRPPAGREPEFQTLLDVVADAQTGRGAVVLVAGPSGIGKSELVRAFTDALAAPDEPGVEVESVICYARTQANPLGPFGEVLRAQTDPKRDARTKRVKALIKEVAPDLLGLIPVIGNYASHAFQIAVKVAAAGGPEKQQEQLASDVADALLHIATDKPLVVVIRDAQWIDDASLEVVSRIIDAPRDTQLVLVLTYDTDLLAQNESFASVVTEAVTRPGLVRRIELSELSRDAVESVLRERYGGLATGCLADWLHDLTSGDPRFLVNYLESLEEQGVLLRDRDGWILDGAVDGAPGDWRLSGAFAEARTPATLEELLRGRIEKLAQDDLSLLETGAVQGRRFLTLVLAELLNRDHRELVRRLRIVADERGMVALENVKDWWSKRSALFAFDPGALERILNERQSDFELVDDHVRVAEALEGMIAEEDPPPRHALLQIAHHYEAADEPKKAAERYVEVAKSTFADGAYRETAVHAQRAADLLRAVPPKELASPDGQALLAWALLLVILGGETSWRAAAANSSGDEVIALANDATDAAAKSGDATLKANTLYATGLVFTAYRGLHEAVAAYEQALDIARKADDKVDEFAILLKLGHQLDSVDLERGRDRLEEAQALLSGGGLDSVIDADRRAFEEARLDMSIGVADFDLGRFGEANERLVRSMKALRERGRCDDLAWSLVFLGQLYTAIGLYEDAEATLRDGVAVFAGRQEALGIRGYLNALLGHLYVEWEQPADAREHLAVGRDEARASGFRGTIPLIEAFWAELLLAEASADALGEARDTLEKLDPFGWPRSQIARASLLARVALAQGRVDEAVTSSTEAVAKLKDGGWHVTATRSEEILFAHAQILAAAGSAEVQDFVGRAQEEVRNKANSLIDAAQKQSFLERVRLSREILTAEA
jgi:tetratricopeptide (TPR) repeat protein/energy-coupling factor transporter ATP-binding protein EcfA2